MWNIEGLNRDKINDSYFNVLISNLHVISFVKTWSDGSQDLSLPGFDLIHRNSRKRDKKARRNSCGISVYIKHGHSKGVKPLKVSNGAKIRNRYNQVPHLTQDTNGKVTNSQKTPQTRAKRSALSQQVTTKHI